MSFEDFKNYLLEQDNSHEPNSKILKGDGKREMAPNYDAETVFGSSSNDGTAEELKEQIIKQDDRHAPNYVLKPTDEFVQAPNFDYETTLGDDGM